MFVLICTNTDNSIKMLYFKTEFWIFKIVIFPSNVDCCLIKAKVLVKIFLTRCNLRLIKIHLFYHWKNNRVTSFFSLCSFFSIDNSTGNSRFCLMVSPYDVTTNDKIHVAGVLHCHYCVSSRPTNFMSDWV